MNPYIQIIAAFFGSLGFALLFNLRGQWLFFTALGGGLSWCVYLISGSFISHYERQYFAAAFFLGIYSELMARKTKSPLSGSRHDPIDSRSRTLLYDAKCHSDEF